LNLYLTADEVGTPSGGGLVTYQESEALKALGPCTVVDRKTLEPALLGGGDPWHWDETVCAAHLGGVNFDQLKLVQIYSGTFSRAVSRFKKLGAKVSYTCAAHSVEESRKEHVAIAGSYDYPHLTDPGLFKRYAGGYMEADLLIVPSTHSMEVVRGQGRTGPIEVIPHGCDLPERVAPPPKTFTVGYLGAVGPDKGLIYLIQAWGKLRYKDAVLKIAGRHTTHPFVQHMIRAAGRGNVQVLGWVGDVSDFYNGVSLYVQPSVTEGFGIEVVEAMAHGRPVLCSKGAGAADLVPEWYRTTPRDAEELAGKIDEIRYRGAGTGYGYPDWRAAAADHTWDKVRHRYQTAWRRLLDGSDRS
jgi:glycosyltransferase involved in cell wall biosynthesis